MEAIRVVAAYCGANVPVGGDAKQPTATVSGSSLTGAATICKAIASASPHAAQLLGATPEAQAQVM